MDKKYLIIAVVAVVVLAGCVAWFGFYDNSPKALSEDVEEFSRHCPVEFLPGNTIEEISYDKGDNKVVADISIISRQLISAGKEQVVPYMTLLFQEEGNRRMLKDMVKSRASMSLRFGNLAVDEENRDEIIIELSPEDMVSIESEPMLTPKEKAIIALPCRAVSLSRQLPVNWADGVQLVGIAVSPAEKNINMYLSAGKIKASDNQAKSFKKELKANRLDNPQVRDLVSELAAAGYGIKVRYVEDGDMDMGSDLIIPAQDIYNISQLR